MVLLSLYSLMSCTMDNKLLVFVPGLPIQIPDSRVSDCQFKIWMNLLPFGECWLKMPLSSKLSNYGSLTQESKSKKSVSESNQIPVLPAHQERSSPKDTTDEMKWKKTGPANRAWNGWREKVGRYSWCRGAAGNHHPELRLAAGTRGRPCLVQSIH